MILIGMLLTTIERYKLAVLKSLCTAQRPFFGMVLSLRACGRSVHKFRNDGTTPEVKAAAAGLPCHESRVCAFREV